MEAYRDRQLLERLLQRFGTFYTSLAHEEQVLAEFEMPDREALHALLDDSSTS